MSMRRNCVKRFLKFNNNWDTYKSFQIQNLKKKNGIKDITMPFETNFNVLNFKNRIRSSRLLFEI